MSTDAPPSGVPYAAPPPPVPARVPTQPPPPVEEETGQPPAPNDAHRPIVSPGSAPLPPTSDEPAPQFTLAPSAAPVQPSAPMGIGRIHPSSTLAPTPDTAPSGQTGSGGAGLDRMVPERVSTATVDLARPSSGEEAYKRASTEQKADANDISLPEVLERMMQDKASDLHLTAGTKPTIRVNGSLVRLDEYPEMDSGMIQRVMYGAITQTQRERFEKDLELDFSYSLPGHGRFRVNLYKQRDSLGAAFRLIPFEIKSLEALGIPPAVREFASMPRGFVLVTGPTGSGKSTTLAALIDHANTSRTDHIMTVEDPIEFLHKHKSCLVNQREVGSDTQSFGDALKHVLRQDPDIILVGEMRDLETISVALTAAETGHLVFATLHTQDAAQTIDRVIDVFPPHQQQQVRQQLAGSLQGVVCQTLCKTHDGRARVVATEVLIVTPAVRNLIREGKTHQIYSAMQAGAKHGMHTLDQHLAQLVREGRISYDTGVEKCHHLEDFNRLCGRG
jgi:twitching motility protein PilT